MDFMKKTLLLCAASAAVIVPNAGAEENWSQFRGPTGRGHAEAADVPLKWSADSVLWKVELKGAGHSSPVNWGDRLFLTSASADGKERYVFAIDRNDGKILWEETVKCDKPEVIHKMNSHATPTCATDGEHVVAFFGPGGLHCFDLDGKKLWSRDVGDFPGDWGIAASPVILGQIVVQNARTSFHCYSLSRLSPKASRKQLEDFYSKRADKFETSYYVANGPWGVEAYFQSCSAHIKNDSAAVAGAVKFIVSNIDSDIAPPFQFAIRRRTGS